MKVAGAKQNDLQIVEVHPKESFVKQKRDLSSRGTSMCHYGGGGEVRAH